jgi:HEAT repeat protein
VSRAREQNQNLAIRLQRAEEKAEARTGSPDGNGNTTLDRERSELLRLRNEMGQLRSLKPELERLRIENAQLRALLDSEKSAAQAEWMAWLSTARTNWVRPTDLPYLLQALTNEATPVRLEATMGLRNIGLQRIFDTNLSSEATAALRAEARAAVPGLMSALKDSDTLVRANAAITLGFLGEAGTVVPALVACLDDPEDRVATGAAKALGRLQADATGAVPALLQAAQSPNQSRRETAINAIKQIDPDAAKAAGLP